MDRSAIKNFESIDITLEDVQLKGFLTVPKEATAIVLFVHGSGSGGNSPRNQMVAEILNEEGFATLLMDIYSEQEEEIDEISHSMRLDIPFLAKRLKDVTLWLEDQPILKKLKVGYLGASTGAAAALVVAAELPHKVHAIVSRGGRPELAGLQLPHVVAPTLLIVGAEDAILVELNQKAYDLLECEKHLELIPNVSQLFEEPGTLVQATHFAAKWFQRFL